jgi:hypothetical protein
MYKYIAQSYATYPIYESVIVTLKIDLRCLSYARASTQFWRTASIEITPGIPHGNYV